MKRTVRRFLALLLSLALIPGLLPILAGCRKNAPADEETENNDSLLTHIYDRVSGADSTGMLNTGVRPWWDGETGTLTYITTVLEDAPAPAQKEGAEDEEDEEEESVQYAVYTLVTLAEDGTSLSAAILDDREGYRIGCGELDGDGLTCAVYSADGGYSRILLSRYEMETGSWTFGEDISTLFAQRPLSLAGLRSDGEGNLYAASDREILILSPDGKKRGSVVPTFHRAGRSPAFTPPRTGGSSPRSPT